MVKHAVKTKSRKGIGQTAAHTRYISPEYLAAAQQRKQKGE
jgi:hypothetical protein